MFSLFNSSEKHNAKDYAFIKRLYDDLGGYYGYYDIYLGINELGYRVAAGLTPKKPLAYLRKIIASKPWDNETHGSGPPKLDAAAS